MSKQRINGKAFEYACIMAFFNHLKQSQKVIIEEGKEFIEAENSFKKIDSKLVLNMEKAAIAAVRVIVRLEPLLIHSPDRHPLYMRIQEDSCGQDGDVRDILAIRDSYGWEIGFSVKHNHDAVKHSRLSSNINFGKKWLGVSNSIEYFNAVKPIFEDLDVLRSTNTKWKDLKEKELKYYVPILNAFADELKRLDETYPGLIPEKLLRYLLGKNDFYKIISYDKDRTTQIQGFNLFGTLNKPTKDFNPQITIPKLHLPSKIYKIEFANNSHNTIQVICDEGWSISFRIHNARSMVEPSLKFDIKLIGAPQRLYSHFEPW